VTLRVVCDRCSTGVGYSSGAFDSWAIVGGLDVCPGCLTLAEAQRIRARFVCSDCGRHMGNAGGLSSHRKSGWCRRERVTR
jgi:hypothetical protein